jgi:beta-xylosidase
MTPWTRLGRTWRAGLVTAALLTGALGTVPAAAGPVAETTPPATATRARPDDPVVHDPTMVKEGDWYYVVSTGDAGRADNFLPVKRSKDLLHWSDLRPVFTTLPPWILPALGLSSAEAPKDLWAPDLSFVHGEWRLY